MNTRTLLTTALAIAFGGIAVPALAHHAAGQTAAQVINLKGGSTLFVFKDGKMAKADKYDRPVHLKNGEVLEATDGRQVAAVGNEVARLSLLFAQDHRSM
jgi:predicted lipoprotein with Yx(FWY)xxD motif